jgi:hypothetical protein
MQSVLEGGAGKCARREGRAARSTWRSRRSATGGACSCYGTSCSGRRHLRELPAGSEEGIASNILADRLKRLADSGLLARDDARPGQRATYSLTEPAIRLIPVLAGLGAWG